MSMYNLLYYSKNFRKSTGSFWNSYPDMPNSDYNGNEQGFFIQSVIQKVLIIKLNQLVHYLMEKMIYKI